MAQTATNPETGETLIFEGGKWKPAQTATNPKTGERVVFAEGKWQPIAGQKPSIGEDIIKGVRGASEELGAFGAEVGFGLGQRAMEAGRQLGMTTKDFEETEPGKALASAAKGYEEAAKRDQPQTIAGKAATIPVSAAEYMTGIAPAMAGAQRYKELTQAGVEEPTAALASVYSFATAAASTAVPFGRGLGAGMVTGAGANIASLVTDKEFTKLALAGKYDEISQRYGISKEELIESGALGAVFGGLIGHATRTTPKGVPSGTSRAAGDAFGELVAEDPAAVRDAVDKVKDPKARQTLHQRIDDLTVKPKDVKKMFAKGELRRTPVEMDEIQLAEMFRKAKERPIEPAITEGAAGAELRNTIRAAHETISAGEKVTPPPGTNDPTVLMNMGIPVTKSQVESAFNSMRNFARKSERYSKLEDSLKVSAKQLVETLNPEAAGPQAEGAAAILAKNIVGRQLKDLRRQGSETRVQFWDARPNEWRKFLIESEKGKVFSDPMLERARDGYRQWAKQIADSDVKKGIIYDTTENYIYHAAEKPDEATKSLANQYGSKWGDPRFAHERNAKFIEDLERAGYRLKTYNPEELMMMRQHASDIAHMKVDALREMAEYGLARRLHKGDSAAPNERVWRSPNGELYAMEPQANQVFHNAFNTKSLWADRSLVGAGYRGLMYAKNKIVPLKLLSLYHPVHVQIGMSFADSVTAADKLLASGKISFKDYVGRNLKSLVLADVVSAPKFGWRMMQAMEGKIPDSQLSPWEREAIVDMHEGGFNPNLAHEFRGYAIKEFKKALIQHSASVAWKLPFAMLEKFYTKPIFEKWIPSLKTAAYLRQVAAAKQARPELISNPLERMKAFRRIQKMVDDRFGEAMYETNFMNRTVKDVGVGGLLSFGWQNGFMRSGVGMIPELGKAAWKGGRIAEQVMAGDLDKSLFVMHYAMGTMFYGGLATLAMTMELPKTFLDYIYPRTGEKNPDGTDARVSTPFYTKEPIAVSHHIREAGVAGGLWDVVAYKANPALGMIASLTTGKDSLNREISDPNSPFMTQLAQRAIYATTDLEPIAVQSLAGEKAKAVSLSAAGFSPAPKYISESGTEAAIKREYRKYHGAPVTSYEKAEQSGDRKLLRKYYEAGDSEKYSDQLLKMRDKYKLTPEEIRRMRQSIKADPSMTMFKTLRPSQQKKILDGMDEEERNRYLRIAHPQVRRHYFEEAE